jgi:mRNA interferase MazF
MQRATSKTDKIYPVEVIITEMKYPSKALCDQMRAISRERFVKKLAELSAGTMTQIEQAILLHLGIEAK